MFRVKIGGKMFSGLLAFVMLLNLLPAPAHAAYADEIGGENSKNMEIIAPTEEPAPDMETASETQEPASDMETASEEGISVVDATDSDVSASDAYVLMNIPYNEFYEAVGVTKGSSDFDAISSATNKTGNYGKSGGAFHSQATAKIENGEVTAVGGENGAENEGVTWAVKVGAGVTLSSLGGSAIAANATKTIATVGRGQTSASYLYGYECLTEASAYSYYTLDSEPSYYLELTVDSDGKPVFSAGLKSTAEEKTGATVTASYGTNWGDVQLKIADASDVSGKLVNAVVLTAEDGSRTTVKAGLVHLYNVWSETDMAWKASTVKGLDGKAIKSVTYYCSDKDDTVAEGNSDAPDYKNYIYQYDVSDVEIPPVYTETISAAFNSASEIQVTGLPKDAQNLKAKVYHSEGGGHNATLTYLTPLEVDPADQDIDPVNADITDGKITISSTLQTVTNDNGDSKTYGQPVDGTEYTIEISCDNYIINKITATYSAGTSGDEAFYVLMNIPYADFYAAEKGDGDTVANIDAVSSATRSKPKNPSLAAGSYHVSEPNDGEGNGDITGTIYPVKVNDVSLLDDCTKVDGQDALFYNQSYAYCELTEEPASYKELSKAGDKFAFSKISRDVTTVSGASAALSTNDHHVDYAINVTGLDAVKADNVSAAALHTSDGTVYGLRHVSEIWRGTSLGFNISGDNDDYKTLVDKTIDKITYYLNDGTICSFSTELKVPKLAGVTATVTSVDAGETSTSFTFSGVLPSGFDPDYKVNLEGATVNAEQKTITLPANAAFGSYALTITDRSGQYAPITGSFSLYGYVLMNIPYNEFYANEKQKDDTVAEIDAVSSATKSKPLSTLAAGSYHVAQDGSDITGVIYPVQIGDASVLDSYTKVTDTDEITYTVNMRGQQVSTTYTGKDALFGKGGDYAYYVLKEKPASYKTLNVRRGTKTFGAVTTTLPTELTGVTAAVSTTDHHVDVAITLSGNAVSGDTTVIKADNVSAVTLHTMDNNVYGLRHVSEIWRGVSLGFNVTGDDDKYKELTGKTVDKITYYLNDGAVYTLTVNLEIPKVHTGTVSAAFDSASQITLTGLPDDIRNPKAKVYHSEGSGREAVLTYLTPLTVNNDHIGAVDVDITDGKIAVSPTPQTVTNSAGESQTYGQPVNGTEYTIEIICDNYIINEITATYTASNNGGNSGSGGNSGGGGSGSSSGGSSSGSSNVTTTRNPDGSTTTTRTNSSTGAVATTTTDQSDNKTETVTQKDGSSVATITRTDGTTATVTTSAAGQVKAEVTLSDAVVSAAQQNGTAAVLPIQSVRAIRDAATAPSVTVTTGSADSVKVEIPVMNPAPGVVAVIVRADGTEEIVKISVSTENGIVVSLPDGVTVKIVENSREFTDVTAENWAKGASDFVTARELFLGVSANTFSPDQPMTRVMLMTVLARFDGEDTSGGATWYEKGMEWAVANGISDGSNPNGDISRQQLATMLWRYDDSPASTGALDAFTDAGQVSDYAQEAIRWAVENKIVNGYGDGRLEPQGQATRAEVAQMLKNFIERQILK